MTDLSHITGAPVRWWIETIPGTRPFVVDEARPWADRAPYRQPAPPLEVVSPARVGVQDVTAWLRAVESRPDHRVTPCSYDDPAGGT